MSCKIYCIEDCNGLKYVGSTTLTLKRRLSQHKYNKKMGTNTSSHKLDLDNCEIKLLETCDVSHKFEREKYWINNTDCVNTLKLNFNQKEYYINNKERIKKQKKEYDKKYREYVKSWGGDLRYINNSLLKIDTTLFQ